MPECEWKGSPVWVEVDLNAIRANCRAVMARVDVPIMGVVKANAYGFGALQVARVMVNEGVAWLAVARVSEALDLRKEGFHLPILVFGYAADGEVLQAADNQITLSLGSQEDLERLTGLLMQAGRRLNVHLKVDTGMGRYGVMGDELLALHQNAEKTGCIKITGVYSHLSVVDSEATSAWTDDQLDRFNQALGSLSENGIHPEFVHCSNSAAALAEPRARYSMVRVGSAFLGIRPFYYSPLPDYLQRVISWKTRLASCRRLSAGWGVGYGHAYTASGDEWIGVAPVGYADGFRRAGGNQVLIAGKRADVVGKVCADACMIRLPEKTPIGTEIVLMGRQGDDSIELEELSERWNTAQADVTCGISARVARLYLGD